MHEDDANGAAPSGARRRSAYPDPPLPTDFYARPAEEVARDLLGCRIVRFAEEGVAVAEIVETEAYVGPHDEASHAAERFGRTTRNEVMFGRPGLAYVYLIYGMHWCLNAVTDAEGYPAAVLVRAAAAIDGVEVMRERRPGRPDDELLRGPGNLCRALRIDGTLNGHDLGSAPLVVTGGPPIPDAEVVRGPRIGISRAVDHPLRFWIRGSRAVSATRRPPQPRPGRR